ncbi:MAG: hypothetical protein C4518_10920 [Desulfobacteraceae bacterium]|nr:MAG: hypothetical protein C4518_10920 [Desulfobacteraceae bacterium]
MPFFFTLCKISLQDGKRIAHSFLLDINAKTPILCVMQHNFKKYTVWFMLSFYLMLTPVPMNHENLVLCFADDCHAEIVCDDLQDHCMSPDDSCRKSCEDEQQLADSHPEECFCCVEIPISNYIQENTPLSRPHDPSGGIQIILAQSRPDNHPLLNKTLFSAVPNPHPVSTPKTLRSVILII